MKIKFLKYHGAGNDFILIDNRFQKYSLKNYQIKFLCHRKYGIGSDGLIFLNHSDDFDFGSIGTLQNTKATNYSGDVLINFSSVTNDDTASIVIEFIKEYDSIS